MENLLGSPVVRDLENPDHYRDLPVYSAHGRPARFAGLSVDRSNLIARVEYGTNMMAEIALDKEVRPVWVKTNGVSIRSIPTNSVIFREIVGDRLISRIIY